MYQFPIGVMLDSFRTDTESALKKAVTVGAQGIQVYATKGEFSPGNYDKKSRKDFLSMVTSYGLRVSALCGDLGQGFVDKAKNPLLIEQSKRILDMANDLDTNIITTHIGVIPADTSHDRYKIMQDACYNLCCYAEDVNSHFAIETGPEPAYILKNFLDAFHSKGIAVNFDPANLVMVTGDDPVEAVYTLKDYIVHTHAKDGIRLKYKDPEIIYGLIEEEIVSSESFRELPLGQGDVDFTNYLKALDDIKYQGFLTIEREVGENPEKDIKQAVVFLKNQLTL
jgi:L-ribulose-5-phosphate 3-epimerase